MRKSKRRSQRGASIILIAALAILLIVAVYLAFRFSMIEGGSNEVRNVVDAAALNVSKKAVQIKVPAGTGYQELADTSGMVGLANINRVWGKAYLINANLQSMQSTGQVGQNASGNAEEAYQQAQAINDQLASSLMNKQALDLYFNQVANNRAARMLGSDATVSTDANKSWATAMVNRGDESNLSLLPQQIPPGAKAVTVKRGGKLFMAGYTPFQANNHPFTFTTFHIGEMPHLCGDSYFEQNRNDTNPIPEARNPLPNAFKESGQAGTSQATVLAAACAVANPMRSYNLALPHCYVSVTFTNTAQWFVEGKQVKTTKYGYEPQTYWEVKQYPLPPAKGGGKLDGYASLGNEYKHPTFWGVFSSLPGDHTVALIPVLQRLQEICPNFTMNQLVGLLTNQPFDPNNQTYYLYPVYNTPDLVDPQIKCSTPANLPGWLNPNAPTDGTPLSVMQEGVQTDIPNYDWENITGGSSPQGPHWTKVSGNIFWSPGTGYNSCLGTLYVTRLTQCYFNGP